MHLSSTIYGGFVLDFDAFGVRQHEGPQHEAPHIDEVEESLIDGVLLQQP